MKRVLPAALAALILVPGLASADFRLRKEVLGMQAAANPEACKDDASWANVSLRLFADLATTATSIVDAAGKHSQTASGRAQIVTTTKKFGNGSLRFDGNSNVAVTSGADFNLGSGDFTIEMYVKTGDKIPVSLLNTATYLLTLNRQDPGTIDFAASNGSPFIELHAQVGANNNAWHHIAAERQGTTLRLYYDGAVAASTTLANGYAIQNPAGMNIGGGAGTDAAGLYGYIDEVRVTKGLARYGGGSFTPAQYDTATCAGRTDQPAGNTAPSISSIANQSVNRGVPTAALAFTVSDAQSGPASVGLTASSNNQTLVPNGNIIFSGDYITPFVTVTPAAGQEGTATITISGSDGWLTGTTSFTVTASYPAGVWLDYGNFRVMKYEAKNNGSGGATSVATGTPFVSKNWNQARTACTALGTGFDLISEAQWLQIANDAMNQPANWTGGSVGNGQMYRGHSDNSPGASLAAVADDAQGYTGTGNTTGSEQKRTLALSNGAVIWDFAGNVSEWSYCDISPCSGGTQPINTSYTGQANTGGFVAWSSAPNAGSQFKPIISGTVQSRGAGVGGLDQNVTNLVKAMRRGGWWADGNNAGAFSLESFYQPTDNDTLNGFRCVGPQ